MENNKQNSKVDFLEKKIEELFLETKSNLVLDDKVQNDLIEIFRKKHSRLNYKLYLTAAIFIGIIFTIYFGLTDPNEIQIANNNYVTIKKTKSNLTIKDSSINTIENDTSKNIKPRTDVTKFTSTSDLCKSVEIVIPDQQEINDETISTITSDEIEIKTEGLNEGIIAYDLMNMVVMDK